MLMIILFIVFGLDCFGESFFFVLFELSHNEIVPRLEFVQKNDKLVGIIERVR